MSNEVERLESEIVKLRAQAHAADVERDALKAENKKLQEKSSELIDYVERLIAALNQAKREKHETP